MKIGTSDATNQLKKDLKISNHVIDLRLYRYQSYERMDYLVSRNSPQLEEEVEVLLEENSKLNEQCLCFRKMNL